MERAWVLNSWDPFIIPKPFSRVVLHLSRAVNVPPEADGTALDAIHAAMQAALDHARQSAEAALS